MSKAEAAANITTLTPAPSRPGHTPNHFDCPACARLRDGMALHHGTVPGSADFVTATARWLELRELAGTTNRARYVRPRTVRDDRQYVRSLATFFKDIPLNVIHAGHIREYQLERSEHVQPLKVNQELGVLRRILQSAKLWTPEMELAYQPLRIEASDVQRALAPDEQARFLEVAASRREWQVVYWYSLVSLQTTCGSGEMRGLRLEDVNMYDRVLQVRAATAKNRYRVRTIPLSEDALWALDRLRDRARALGAATPQHYLFPFRMARGAWDPSRPMTDSGIKRPFEEVRSAAGVEWLRMHDLRHCAITRMAEAGVPIATMMGIAGHISPRMTQHYTQISDQAKRQAVVQAFEQHPTRMKPQIVAELHQPTTRHIATN